MKKDSVKICALLAVLMISGAEASSLQAQKTERSGQRPVNKPYCIIPPNRNKLLHSVDTNIERERIDALELDTLRRRKVDVLLNDFHKEELKIARMQFRAQSNFDKKLKLILTKEEYEKYKNQKSSDCCRETEPDSVSKTGFFPTRKAPEPQIMTESQD